MLSFLSSCENVSNWLRHSNRLTATNGDSEGSTQGHVTFLYKKVFKNNKIFFLHVSSSSVQFHVGLSHKNPTKFFEICHKVLKDERDVTLQDWSNLMLCLGVE